MAPAVDEQSGAEEFEEGMGDAVRIHGVAQMALHQAGKTEAIA